MNVIQTVITTTLFLPVLFGCGGGEMKTVELYAKATLADVNFIIQRDGYVWENLSTGLNARAYAVLYDELGNLYVGGSFTTAGGEAANYIAKWDGAAWSALADGFDGTPVYDLAIGPDGTLYAVGNFAHIAAWNGSAWSALGDGTNATSIVRVVVGLDGIVYVCGNFSTAEGDPAVRIAQWDGATWEALGDGLNDLPWAMAIGLDGSLYVGGAFTTADGVSCAKIAKWNGTTFEPLGTGLNGTVRSMYVAPNGILYVGGEFTTAGGVAANYIAAWNGSTWTALGSGLNGHVNSMVYNEEDGLLYVGGVFTTAGDLSLADAIAAWNGSTWKGLNIDLFGSSTVASIDYFNNKLAFGFTVDTPGDAYISGTGAATITNDGSADSYPKFIISRAGGTSATLQSIVNNTTGDELLFDWALLDGETVTIDLAPGKKTITSSFTGNAINQLLPNSDISTWRLVPGVNDVALFISDVGSPTLSAFIQWQNIYNSADG